MTEKQEWDGVERRKASPCLPMWQWEEPREKPARIYTREEDVPGYKEAVRRFAGLDEESKN